MLGAEGFFVDSESPTHERLRLGQPVCGSEQLCEVAQANGNLGILRSEGLFIDGKSSAQERLRFGQPVLQLKCLREIIKICATLA